MSKRLVVLVGLMVQIGTFAAGVAEPGRQVDVLKEVDVLVIGSSSSAAEAALAARKTGASVFLVAGRPYVGDDIAGTLRIRFPKDSEPQTALAKKLYRGKTVAESGETETTPLAAKRLFDRELLGAGVTLLTGCFATEPLVDAKGNLYGAAVVNKSGRQAVLAKVVIDGSERAAFAKRAGAQAYPFKQGLYEFSRRVISGKKPSALGMDVRESAGVCGFVGSKANEKIKVTPRMYECVFSFPLKNGDDAEISEIEQKMRDLSWNMEQLDSADCGVWVPTDRVKCRSHLTDADKFDVAAFAAAGVEGLFVLGGMGDVSDTVAEQLLLPALGMSVAERIGQHAARTAERRSPLVPVAVGRSGGGATTSVKESTERIWVKAVADDGRKVWVDGGELPELGACDVLVVGAGTGGAPAAIAAARQGSRVIVCDYLYEMGGVQTVGFIGRYYFGNRVGFTAEIDAGVKAGNAYTDSRWKAEWYRQECRKAGADIRMGTIVAGVLMEGGRITGAIVVTPAGVRGVIRANAVIDATGNADIAHMAGEETEFMDPNEIALQGAGVARKTMLVNYANSDIGFVDETDAADLCYFALRSRLSLGEDDWDLAQNINSRERRRMIGVHYITPMDVLLKRTYPDTIVQPMSNFDSHGQTTHDTFFVADFGHTPLYANFPYRAILPKKTDGLLVIGLGASAHRDAMPVLRMQPDIQNQGYAAGVACAMAVRDGKLLRDIDIKALQRHLIEKKILPESVLTDTDSFPVDDETIREAVRNVVGLPIFVELRKMSKAEAAAAYTNYIRVCVIYQEAVRAKPLLEKAYKEAETESAGLVYAHLLAMLGSGSGEDRLIAKIEATGWDSGWNFRGMGQFGRSVSWVDSYIIALARCRSEKALPVIEKLAGQLTGQYSAEDRKGDFSHFRAIGIYCRAIGNTRAAAVLERLIGLDGVAGNAIRLEGTMAKIPEYKDSFADKERTLCLRELVIASDLYRLNSESVAAKRSLTAFSSDPRGVYARFACRQLERAR